MTLPWARINTGSGSADSSVVKLVWSEVEARKEEEANESMAKTEAAPLTPETVTEAVKEVEWDDLCTCLFVPHSKRDEFQGHYPVKDRRRVLVDWWFSTDPAPSWRRLIQQLDRWFEIVTASKIRCNAEPIQDPTFTLHNVTTAVGSVYDWKSLRFYLGVPLTRCGSKEEMLQYFITTMPNASWQTLAGGLYCGLENEALERVTKYFQRQPEATLTVANLCTALDEIVEWGDLGLCLGVPELIQKEIKKKYPNVKQKKQAMLAEWRNHHPAPSWMVVANAVYSGYIGDECGKYHKVLQLVKEKYLKGTETLPEQQVSSTDTSPTPSASSRNESGSKLSLVEIEYSDLEIMEKVGSGGFGTVSKGRWISKNKTVAVKTTVELEEREVRILSSLDHPSIIQYYATARESNLHFIITEFAENGSIYDYIFEEHKQPPLSQILLWATQIAEGMAYLHQQNIIHRDLKCSNVVLTSTLNAKICDLGSARSLQHTTQQTTAVGTYAWMAPEMLRREEVSKSCDVYSYGVLVFEIATQQVPFHDVIPILAAVMTMEGKRPTIPETCDPLLADLIKCCWNQDAKARPSFKEILETLSTVTN